MQVALDVRAHQLAASQRMAARLHEAHAALGAHAEELGARAERADALAQRLRLSAAQPLGAFQQSALQNAADEVREGRREPKDAAQQQYGQRPRAVAAADREDGAGKGAGAGGARSSVREYVRTLDSSLALPLQPAATTELRRGGEPDEWREQGWERDGELALGRREYAYGDDNDLDDGTAMPMPDFAD
ncbi:hypothetical protein T492DRAFT_1082624 [Pavlovales sp. CCMP2436]|nr:hypothetical protein T492DRAFT_1082624 [Pavlovales sp. CCMP2436]